MDMAVLNATGITVRGIMKILTVKPMYQKSKQTYTLLFWKLQERGPEEVWLLVADAGNGKLNSSGDRK